MAADQDRVARAAAERDLARAMLTALLEGRKDQRLWPEDLAKILDLPAATVKQLVYLARRNDRDNRPRPLDLPLPGGTERRKVSRKDGLALSVVSPWWWPDQVTAWLDRRADPAVWAEVWPRGESGRFVSRETT